MPAFCRPWQEGGVGFDYRLQMAIADKWIEVRGDEQWGFASFYQTRLALVNTFSELSCIPIGTFYKS